MADMNEDDRTQLNAAISRDLKRRLDVAAAQQQRAIREVIEEALKSYLDALEAA